MANYRNINRFTPPEMSVAFKIEEAVAKTSNDISGGVKRFIFL